MAKEETVRCMWGMRCVCVCGGGRGKGDVGVVGLFQFSIPFN